MVQCNRCHLQYIVETKRRLKDRFNEHRRPVDKTNISSKPTTVSEHFLSQPNHCHTDMQLIPLEVIHSSRDSIRKARESFLIDLAGTLEPHGLNRRDEFLFFLIYFTYFPILWYHLVNVISAAPMYCNILHDIYCNFIYII